MEEGEEDEKKEERRERKGVRVRVRLGVGGAIRNYCGTIDKRRLRGRTTEDSLRPSDFPSTVASLFRLFSLFPGSLGLPLLASCRSLRTVPCPRNLPDSSICNVRKPARYAILVRPFYVEQKILPDLVYFSGRAERAAVGQVDPVNTRYSTIPSYGNRYDYEQISWMLWYLWTCMQKFL